MLCCVGLFAGLAVGQTLGGPWSVIAPAAGFGIGFLADMKLMKGMHGKAGHAQAPACVEPRGPIEDGAESAGPPAAGRNPVPAQDAGRA